MTRTLRAMLAALLALTMCAAGPVTARPTVPVVAANPVAPLPVLTDPVYLMIAGDSTAAGQPVACGDGTHYGDRQVLGDWLNRVGGRDVRFVGGNASSCGAPYQHHQGRGGETIVSLTATIAGHLQANPADILVLRVGVNDATSTSGWRAASQMATDYGHLLDAARAQIPGIRIVASEIIPPDGAVSADLARASVTARKFNAMLPAIVAPYGDSVHIAHNGMITPVWLADGLHPDGKGYVWIADALMQDPGGGLWSWLSADPPPAVKPWDVPIDPWRVSCG